MAQALIRFPGITKTLGGLVTLSRGPFPSAALIYFVPQPSLNLSEGDLTITYGSDSITLTECQPEMASLRMHKAGDGFIQSILILDRRRKWMQSRLTQDLNRRMSDGDIPSANKVDLQTLAGKLLQACGETSHDVSNLSASNYPRLSVVAGNAAYELDRLCDESGCDIVLLENSVKIVKRNTGSPLPSGGRVASPEYEFTPDNGPEYFTVDAGPTLWDGNLKLEAVGIDTDGCLKPIADLTYAPSSGWASEHPLVFPNIGRSNWPLARSSVYRIYRVKSMVDDTLELPGLTSTDTFSVSNAHQIKIQSHRLAVCDSTTGRERPAEVVGSFWNRSEAFKQSNDIGEYYSCDVGFTLDTENGLVIFDDIMCSLDSSGCFGEAELYLKTSWMVEGDGGQLVRASYSVDRQGAEVTAPLNPENLAVSREELQARYYLSYNDAGTYSSTKVGSTNQTSVTAEANSITSALREPYTKDRTQKVLMYEGIKEIPLDGKVQQVTYEISHLKDGMARTIASENFEHESLVDNQNRRKEAREALRKQ